MLDLSLKKEMHVEDSASMKTEQDVNEATAALKGMLGLGTAPATSSKLTTAPPVATVLQPASAAKTETESSAKEEPKKFQAKKSKGLRHFSESLGFFIFCILSLPRRV